jgi:hypothetical protein
MGYTQGDRLREATRDEVRMGLLAINSKKIEKLSLCYESMKQYILTIILEAKPLKP